MFCKGCKAHKGAYGFYVRRTGSRAGKPYKKCKDCFRKRGREYYHSNKKRQLPLAISRTRKSRKIKSDYIRKIKDVPCADCHTKYPHYVMDFDHRDKRDKITNVASLVTRNWSIEKIKSEIKKCDIVCANCHRIRTYKDKLR